MNYAIIKNINGNYFIHAEGITALENAKTNYHALCQTLWNAPDVITAHVAIVNEQLNVVDGYKEYIHHEPQPESAPEPEDDGKDDSGLLNED